MRPTSTPAKRILVLALVSTLSAAALLAVGILLLGRFGQTEGRILGTTGLIAAYGLLALPAGILYDQGRLRSLATAGFVLAVAGLSLALTAVWMTEAPSALGRTVATVTAFAAVSTQTTALASRRRAHDPTGVRELFAVSCGLALVLAGMISVAAWEEIDRQSYFRVVAALAVIDLLLVVLQPILALARPAARVHRLRMVVEQDTAVETAVKAADFASAAAKAIRAQERGGRRVMLVERVDRGKTEIVKPRPAMPGSHARPRAGRAQPSRARPPRVA